MKKENVVLTKVSPGLYCIPDNTWIKVKENGLVRVSAHHVLLNAIEYIKSIEFPRVNEMRHQMETCVTIHDSKKNVYRLWIPVTGKTVTINEMVRQDYDKLIDAPYTDGWILLIEPSYLEKDMENLMELEVIGYKKFFS